MLGLWLTVMSIAVGVDAGDTAGVGRLPALGWNSWNAYGCDVNETKILSAAKAIVDLGLKDVGYNYVNIDDCWSVESGRNSTTHQIEPDLTKFPDGISGTASKVHAMGLKLGIYSSAGTKTCAGYPASIGYESIDAATFAGWGIDYLKYDNCAVPQNWTDTCEACWLDRATGTNGTCTSAPDQGATLCPKGYNYSQSNTAKRYGIMRDALKAQKRPILYSLCEWGTEDVISWGNQTAQSWRITDDIQSNWARILSILNQASFMTHATGFYGHNDLDMLEVGNNNLSEAECRTHFAFWAANKSPLLIGTNLSNLSSSLVSVLKNSYLLAFSQDATFGQSAQPFSWGENPDWTFNASFPAQYWASASSNGTLVLLMNPLGDTKNLTASFSKIPGLQANANYSIVNVWTNEVTCSNSGAITVPVESHDTAAFLVKQKC